MGSNKLRQSLEESQKLAVRFVEAAKSQGYVDEQEIAGLIKVQAYQTINNWVCGANRMTNINADKIRAWLKNWNEPLQEDETDVSALLSLSSNLPKKQVWSLIHGLMEIVEHE